MVILLVSNVGMGQSHTEEELGWDFSTWVAKPRKSENKFPHESRKVHTIFPKNGLAGVVKKNFPMSGVATNGEFFFTTTARPWMEKKLWRDETFTFIIGMWIQSFLEFGTGKIPYSSLKVH